MPARLKPTAVGLALLALGACGFPEGPDWPPLSDATAVAGATADWRTLHGSQTVVRPSLDTLVAGDPGPPRQAAAELVGQERPLAIVHFGAARPDFAPALYDVVRRALELRPASSFALVGVAPPGGDAANEAVTADLEQVFQTLLTLGLPANRLSLSTIALEGVAGNEVHLYVL